MSATSASSTASPAPPQKVAIVGAGIAGLALAGVLSRKNFEEKQKGNPQSFALSVFERGAVDRDQGYGFDLDTDGRRCLELAGVTEEEFQAISRAKSGVTKMVDTDFKNIYTEFQPMLLQKLFPTACYEKPETNRTLLRELLLRKVAENDSSAVVLHEVDVNNVRSKNASQAELFENTKSLGTFDLVIDSAGVHSKLRKHVVDEALSKKQYEGGVMVHGVINSPEESFGGKFAGITKALGEGTLVCFNRGSSMQLQRFGADADDKRTSFIYFVRNEHLMSDTEKEKGVNVDENFVLRRMEGSLAEIKSRSAGILKSSGATEAERERVRKIKDFVKLHMRGEEQALIAGASGAESKTAVRFDWHENFFAIVDALDTITVRAQFTHSQQSEEVGAEAYFLEESELPLACIGDSLRNVGLGGGGLLAMKDSLELGELLADAREFGEKVGEAKKLQRKFMQRRIDFYGSEYNFRGKLLWARGTDHFDGLEQGNDGKESIKLSLADLMLLMTPKEHRSGVGARVKKAVAPVIGALVTSWARLEGR